jgi:hypothetical protein
LNLHEVVSQPEGRFLPNLHPRDRRVCLPVSPRYSVFYSKPLASDYDKSTTYRQKVKIIMRHS